MRVCLCAVLDCPLLRGQSEVRELVHLDSQDPAILLGRGWHLGVHGLLDAFGICIRHVLAISQSCPSENAEPSRPEEEVTVRTVSAALPGPFLVDERRTCSAYLHLDGCPGRDALGAALAEVMYMKVSSREAHVSLVVARPDSFLKRHIELKQLSFCFE